MDIRRPAQENPPHFFAQSRRGACVQLQPIVKNHMQQIRLVIGKPFQPECVSGCQQSRRFLIELAHAIRHIIVDLSRGCVRHAVQQDRHARIDMDLILRLILRTREQRD